VGGDGGYRSAAHGTAPVASNSTKPSRPPEGREMSNFPPGMTREDWKHIDGEGHHCHCPMHEDYEHDCSKEARKYLRPEFSPPCWVLSIRMGHCSYTHIRVDYCPWCAEDLGRPECICKEIDELAKAEVAERKGGG